jgi:hypothetical protein
MPLVFQHRIYRKDLQANPDVLYVFGDNVVRAGLGGQAGEMRGEPNALGIATKNTPSSGPGAFFSDEDYPELRQIIENDFRPVFSALSEGRIVVLPSDGIGTGLSDMPARCPVLFAYVTRCLEKAKRIADNYQKTH